MSTMGRKCRVTDCLSDSKRPEDLGVTFHKVPFHSDIRPKWLSLCRIPPDNVLNKIIYICSRHFRRNDFCTFKGTKYMLKQGVLPSMFPWTNEPRVRPTSTPQKPKEETKPSTSTIEKPITEKTPVLLGDKSKMKPYDASQAIKQDDVEEAKGSIIVKEVKIEDPVIPEEPIQTINCDVPDLVHKIDRIRTKSITSRATEKRQEIVVPVIPHVEELKKEIKDEPGADSPFPDDYLPVTDFSQGSKVEVTDFSGQWFPAKISEIDYTENEVFIQFEDATKNNEWIPMDSKRLRQYTDTEPFPKFDVGERVMARWKNSIKFPAIIQKCLENETYEVLFDDNVPYVLKASKISRVTQQQMKQKVTTPITPKAIPSPLFAPVEGSKQDRRDRKRKLNVAELFTRKRTKLDTTIEGSGTISNVLESDNDLEKEIKTPITPKMEPLTDSGILSSNSGDWICRWVNGDPVGIPSMLDSRRSVIVDDPKIPPGWLKHFVCRAQGSSAGKWDTVVVSPEGKKFRSRNDVQTYLDKEKLPHHIEQFDFSLHLKKARSLGLYEINENIKKETPKPSLITAAKGKITPKVEAKVEVKLEIDKEKTPTPVETPIVASLKILFENGAYKCPIEGCSKTFRKENLTQMHVKHYHPEFSKMIGSTPNVADLAYARTVGGPIEDYTPKRQIQTITSPPIERKIDTTPKTSRLSLPPKLEPMVEKIPEPEKVPEIEKPKKVPEIPKIKESEIAKLLNSDPKPLVLEPKISKITNNSTNKKAPNMHFPEIREPPRISEIKETRNVFDPKPAGGGIRTLLPVIRAPQDPEKKYVPPTPPEIPDIEEPPMMPSTKSLLTKAALGKHLKRRRNNSEETTTYKKRRYTKHDYDYYPDFDQGSRSPEYVPNFGHHVGRRRKHHHDFNNELPPVQEYNTYQQQHPKHIVTETGEVIKIVTMKQEEIINCTCGFMEEDGLMIQCELCLCWQHAYCNSIEREDQVPEKYICYICQNPLRMRSSRKYYHDQDWLKLGALPVASFHAKDETVVAERFERLRQSHELSGNLHELSNVMHSLKVKLKVAGNKDHAKFYLWSKPWPKLDIDNNIREILENNPNDPKPENSLNTQNNIAASLSQLLNAMNQPNQSTLSYGDASNENPDQSLQEPNNELLNILEDHAETIEAALNSENKDLVKMEDQGDKPKWVDNGTIAGEVSDGEMISQALASEALANDLLSSPNGINLASLSQSDIEKIQNTIENSGNLVNPCIPEPEAKIEPETCRDNLLDHISTFQTQIGDRMDKIEEQIARLEVEDIGMVTPRAHVDQKLKETFIMMLRDLGKMRKLAALY